MKSILKLLSLVIILNNVSFAQFYEKTFELGVRSYGWSIKKTLTGYKMSGVYFDPNKDEFNGMDVFTLDFNDKLDISKMTLFSSSSRDVIPLLNKDPKLDILSMMVNFDTDAVFVKKLDNTSNPAMYKFGDTEIYSITNDENQNTYLTGNLDYRGLIQKFDKDMNLVFSKEYVSNSLGYNEYHFINKLNDGTFANYGSGLFNGVRTSLVTIVDSNGDFQGAKLVQNYKDNLFLGACQLNNNNIVCVGITQKNGFVLVMDESGQLIKAIDLSSNNGEIFLNRALAYNNKFYLVGTIENGGNKKIIVVLMNQEGKIESVNEMNSNYSNLNINDAYKYKDNEVLICGSVNKGKLERPLLIKTNIEFNTCNVKQSSLQITAMDVTKQITFTDVQLNGSDNFSSDIFTINETSSNKSIKSTPCQIIQPFQCGTGSFEWENIASKYADFNFIKRAAFADSTIYLTDNNFMEVGSVWSKQRKYVTKGFRTNFTFSMSQGSNYSSVDGSDPGADGIVFVIQNNSNTDYGPPGGALGYEDIPNALAFEFDTFKNPSYNDQNGNHFAIQTSKKGKISMVHKPENTLFMNDKIPLLEQNKKYTCQIEYLEELKTLTVYLDTREDLATKQEIAKLTDFKLENHINLTAGRAYIGFTSSTGTATENHKINNWDLCLLGEDPDIQSDVLLEETNSNIEFDEIKLFDLLGKELLQLNSFEELNQNIDKFNSGIYFATKYLKGKFISSQKLIKN